MRKCLLPMVLALLRCPLADVDAFPVLQGHQSHPQANLFSSPATSYSALNMMSLFGRLRRRSRSRATGTANSPNTTTTPLPAPPVIQWEVYVDQSKASLDRGGSATLDAFLGLAPLDTVQVFAAILNPITVNGKSNRGPLVRCISTDGLLCCDVANVDSVDKVYRTLTRHLNCSSRVVDYQTCLCLKWKYKGNAHLEAGKVDQAIDAYNEALTILAGGNNVQGEQSKRQEGILLLMRATAYLARASGRKERLKQAVQEWTKMVPDAARLKNVYEQTQGALPSVSHSVFRRVLADSAEQERLFKRTQYWHGLYQYSLLNAAQDVLLATHLLPDYSRGWARAGEILSELWKLSESAQCYDMAVQCDPSLEDRLKPVIERVRKRQDLLESARAYGWSEDTLRLALDVAG